VPAPRRHGRERRSQDARASPTAAAHHADRARRPGGARGTTSQPLDQIVVGGGEVDDLLDPGSARLGGRDAIRRAPADERDTGSGRTLGDRRLRDVGAEQNQRRRGPPSAGGSGVGRDIHLDAGRRRELQQVIEQVGVGRHDQRARLGHGSSLGSRDSEIHRSRPKARWEAVTANLWMKLLPVDSRLPNPRRRGQHDRTRRLNSTFATGPDEGEQMSRDEQRGRPPPGGIAGAVKARLRGVEPDAYWPRQVTVHTLDSYTCTPSSARQTGPSA
jgi:hypothetical protein